MKKASLFLFSGTIIFLLSVMVNCAFSMKVSDRSSLSNFRADRDPVANIQVVGDTALVRRIPEGSDRVNILGGIASDKGSIFFGEVIGTGDGWRKTDAIEAGDILLCDPNAATQIKVNDQDYWLVKYDQTFGRIDADKLKSRMVE